MKNINLKTLLILTFQLGIIMVLVSFGTMYVKKLASHSGITIKDNLQSVRYCSAMRKTLLNLKLNPDQIQLRVDFEKNLQSELDNITEPGEMELAHKINDAYFRWLKFTEDRTFNEIQRDIEDINELNINAIEKRNKEAQHSASSANTNIILLGFFGGLIAVFFTFTFIGQFISQKSNSEPS